MSDEIPAPNQSDNPPEGSPKVQSSEPVKAPETAQPQPNTELQEVKTELTGFEKATLRWTIVVVLINALTCLFIYLQWHEMKSGSTDTHTLAEAAKTQADKMANVSDAADKIRQAAENMVIQDQRIADNAQNSLNASNAQSKAALNATQESMRQDQRAWISTEPATGVPTDEGPYTIQFPIKNSGKTPAKNVTVYFVGKFFKPGERLTYRFEGNPIPSGYIAPNSPRSFTYHGGPENGIDVTAHKGEILVVYGAITYDDIFSGKHWVTYCFLAPKGDSYAYCNEHNDIGDGPLPKGSLQF